jgi:hypothetical protein
MVFSLNIEGSLKAMLEWLKYWKCHLFWQPMATAPKGMPILVWDEYYLMRIARWEMKEVAEIWGRTIPDPTKAGAWIQDLPYGNDPGRGEIGGYLDPVRWRYLPGVPKV